MFLVDLGYLDSMQHMVDLLAFDISLALQRHGSALELRPLLQFIGPRHCGLDRPCLCTRSSQLLKEEFETTTSRQNHSEKPNLASRRHKYQYVGSCYCQSTTPTCVHFNIAL